MSVADCAGEALTSSRVGAGSWRQKSVQQHQPGLVDKTTVSAKTISKPGPAYVQWLRLKEHQRKVKAVFALAFWVWFFL